MLPSERDALVALAFFCEARRYRLPFDGASIAIRSALRGAAHLAGDRPEDGPIAFMFLLTLHPRAMGDAWDKFPVVYMNNLLRAHAGKELAMGLDDPEMEDLRLAVVIGRVSYAEARDWIAARLRALCA